MIYSGNLYSLSLTYVVEEINGILKIFVFNLFMDLHITGCSQRNLFIFGKCLCVCIPFVSCLHVFITKKIIAYSEELMNIIPPNCILRYTLIGIVQLGLTAYCSTGDTAFFTILSIFNYSHESHISIYME